MVLNGKTDPFLSLVDELDTKQYAAIPYLENVKPSNSKLTHTPNKTNTRKANTKKAAKPSWLA